MSRKSFSSTSIQRVYVADGFADDCDELIHRCSRVDILSYQSFCIYYKDMNFASIFQGRTSNAEIAELTEELLQIAKYYMVLDTSNFEESVAGLFLVYALLNLQPYPGFAPLRVVPDDLPALARIQSVARRERRYDVLYILGSVLVKGPVQYHAAGRERGMEAAIRKYLEGNCILDLTGVRPKGVYFRQNEELDIIREMSGVFKRYSAAKEQIPSVKKHKLTYSNDNLASELGTSLKRLINGLLEEDADIEPADHYNAVQEIKTRAMRGAVSTVRHLNAADQRSPEKKKPQSKTESKSPKKQSPKKPSVATKRAKTKKAKSKRPKKQESSSSDEEDEIREKKSPASATFNKLETPQPEQEIYVEIDSLPSIITTESEGKLVEIEIIDEMKKKPTESEGKVVEKEVIDEMKKKPTESQGKVVEIEIIDEMKKKQPTEKGKAVEKEVIDEMKKKQTESEGKVVEIEIIDEMKGKKKRKKSEASGSDDAIFKKPLRMPLRASPRLSVQRRDMKQTVLKSKFKRMGMLPVANFEEK